MAKPEANHLSPVQLARALGAKPLVVSPRKPFHDYVPMLASAPPQELAIATLAKEGWLYELKLDGARIVGERNPRGNVRLRYRSKRDATASYPEIAEALAGLSTGAFVVDGEIVTFDERGRPSFQRLQRRFGLTEPREVGRARRDVPVAFVVFDALSVEGLDLTPLPLVARRAILERLVPGSGIVTRLDGVEHDGRPLYALCETHDLEGVIAKRLDSPYRPGARSDTWLKVKRVVEDDFVVVGMTRPEGGRRGFGALDLATYVSGELVYRGRVGSGFDETELTRIARDLAGFATKVAAVAVEPDGKTVMFFKPVRVVRVRYAAWSDDGRLRAPVFVAEREDLEPEMCCAAP